MDGGRAAAAGINDLPVDKLQEFIGAFRANFGQQAFHPLPAIACQFPPDKVSGLNAVSPLVNRRDAGIAIILGSAGFLDESHAAMHLHAQRSDFAADIRAIGFGQRGDEVEPLLCTRNAHMRPVHLAPCIIDQCAGRLRQRLHAEQHPPHIWMLDDRHRFRRGTIDAGRLDALCGIGQRLLRGALANLHALAAYIETGLVHHREHRLHAAAFAADQFADAIVMVAIGHDAGGRGVDAQLVLNRRAMDVVESADVARRTDPELRYDEE